MRYEVGYASGKQQMIRQGSYPTLARCPYLIVHTYLFETQKASHSGIHMYENPVPLLTVASCQYLIKIDEFSCIRPSFCVGVCMKIQVNEIEFTFPKNILPHCMVLE